MVRPCWRWVAEQTLNEPFSNGSASSLHAGGMKDKGLLTVMSLLSIVLSLIHVTDDVVRGKDRFPNLLGMLIWVVWLYGTLVLRERLLGKIIMLLGAILSAGIPILHLPGTAAAAKTSGAFLFLGTLLALGISGLFSIVLAVQGLIMTAAAHENPDR